MIKAVVAGEKGWLPQSMKQWDDFIVILHSKAAYVFTDAPEMDPPRTQAFPLRSDDVFVQYIHATRRRFSVRSIRKK